MNDAIRVARAMRVYGGSFISALGQALQCADEDNTRRIKEAFPEAWEMYTSYARLEARAKGEQEETEQ